MRRRLRPKVVTIRFSPPTPGLTETPLRQEHHQQIQQLALDLLLELPHRVRQRSLQPRLLGPAQFGRPDILQACQQHQQGRARNNYELQPVALQDRASHDPLDRGTTPEGHFTRPGLARSMGPPRHCEVGISPPPRAPEWRFRTTILDGAAPKEGGFTRFPRPVNRSGPTRRPRRRQGSRPHHPRTRRRHPRGHRRPIRHRRLRRQTVEAKTS